MVKEDLLLLCDRSVQDNMQYMSDCYENCNMVRLKINGPGIKYLANGPNIKLLTVM